MNLLWITDNPLQKDHRSRNIERQENITDDKKCQDFKKNEVKFVGKLTVEVKNTGVGKNVTLLKTEREDLKSLLGADWL